VFIPHSPRLLIIVGATGVGKTRMALKLAETCGAEIISADSMQVYRYMNIGTAKPAPAERQNVRHHLIDVVDPDEDFNVASFMNIARQIMATSASSEKKFIVVGGTGLYIKALLGGLAVDVGADTDLRADLRRQLEIFGRDHLYRLLQEKDPVAAGLFNPHDTVRIIRAIEVRSQSGKSIVEMQKKHNFTERPYRYLKIGLKMERQELYRGIERRADGMMAAGFVEEVQWLLAQGYHGGLKSMQSLGYRHLTGYLQGESSLINAVDGIKRDTRQYAKRQETWFKKDPEIRWFNHDEFASVANMVDAFLNRATDETLMS
jgi:tRNA dimethylallyltransferase